MVRKDKEKDLDGGGFFYQFLIVFMGFLFGLVVCVLLIFLVIGIWI